MLLERLAECLAYVEKFAPKYDVASLQARTKLPDGDVPSWGDLLAQAPAAVIHRSEALRGAAWALTEGFVGMLETDELEQFFAARRQRLGAAPDARTMALARHELTRSRALLIVDPAASLFDGAAMVASSGYFDHNNIPPWDTWLLVVPPPAGSSGAPCLLCWVPEWAGDWVDGGVRVNPESCLSWAEMRGEAPSSRGWGLDWEAGDRKSKPSEPF